MTMNYFDKDAGLLHKRLRSFFNLTPGGELDRAVTAVAEEAYVLGMMRGVERTHARVRRVVYTIVGMLAGIVALAVFAGWTV